MAEQRHSMDLVEFARLAGRGELPKSSEGIIVISPSLAEALDTILDRVDELAVAGPLADALAEIRALHDYRARRLGGRPVDG